MTYRITVKSEYHDAFEKDSFKEFIANEFPYDRFGDQFPEITETEFETIKTEMIARYDNPLGDITKIPGLVDLTRTETPQENVMTIDFIDEEAYTNFLTGHFSDNRAGGVMIAATIACEHDYRNDVVNGRKVVSAVDPDLAPGTILLLGRYIIKQWQIVRKSVQTVTHETI